MFKFSTVAEIEAEAVRFQAKIGTGFTVSPNSHGLHVRCNKCGISGTHDRAYRVGDLHTC